MKHNAKGDRITLEKIKFARPGTGISPNNFSHINGHRLTKDVDAEDILQWEMLETWFIVYGLQLNRLTPEILY